MHLQVSKAGAASLPVLREQDVGLLKLGRWLRATEYKFTTVTPETHRRVLGRAISRSSVNLRDVFGWNRTFQPKDLNPKLLQLMQDAGTIDCVGDTCVSTVRYATYESLVLLHSGFPTVQKDSVFLGPDTYRFLRYIQDKVRTIPSPTRIADIGTGSGAAAILLAGLFPQANIIATDINDQALRFADINTDLNCTYNVTTLKSDVAAELDHGFDLIVANPPYLVDPEKRRYRHGGGNTGAALSLRILTEGAGKLSPTGHLILYTGVAIIDGCDEFKLAADLALEQTPWRIQQYGEIDCDVFGEELETTAYANSERIAVVGLVLGARDSMPNGVS